MPNAELDQAIQGYRRAKAAEGRRAAVGSIGAVGAALAGADAGTAIQTGQAIRAGQAPVSVGGQAGLSPGDLVQAQLKMAEIEGKLRELQTSQTTEFGKSETEKSKEQMKLLADLVGTYGSVAGTGATAGATVAASKASQIGGILRDSVALLDADETAATSVETEAANQFMAGFPVLLESGKGGAALMTDPAFITGLSAALAKEADPHAKLRLADAIGARIGFPLKDAIVSQNIAGYAAAQGIPLPGGDPALGSVAPHLDTLNRTLGNAAGAIQAENEKRKAQTAASRAGLDELQNLPGAGTNRQQAVILDIIRAVRDGNVDDALTKAAAGVPENQGLNDARSTLLNLPEPVAPLTSAFDAKQKIMKSSAFEQQRAASGLDPEAFFKAQLKLVGQRTRQRIDAARAAPPEPEATPPVPEKPPTKLGVPYNVNDLVQ